MVVLVVVIEVIVMHFLLCVSKNTNVKSESEATTVEDNNQYLGEGWPSYDDFLDDDTTAPALTHEEILAQLMVLQMVQAAARPEGSIAVVEITPVVATAASAHPDRPTPAATSDSTVQSPAGDRPVSPETTSGAQTPNSVGVEGDYIHSFRGPSR